MITYKTIWVIIVAQSKPVYTISAFSWDLLKEDTFILSIAGLLERSEPLHFDAT
jgi:hypothetical protein